MITQLKKLLQSRQTDHKDLIYTVLNNFKVLRKSNYEPIIIFGGFEKDIVVHVYKENNNIYALKISALVSNNESLLVDIDKFALLNKLKCFHNLKENTLETIEIDQVFYLDKTSQVIQMTSLLNFLMNSEYLKKFVKGNLYGYLLTPNQVLSAMEINRGEPGCYQTILTEYSDRIVESLHS